MSNDKQAAESRFQPSSNPKVFYRQVESAVLAPCPYLVRDHWYQLKDLLTGSDLWDQTGKGVHIRAGRSFGWMARKGLVPFAPAPRNEGQTGTRYYLYIGPEIY